MSAPKTSFLVMPGQLFAGDSDPFLFRRASTWWLLVALFLLGQENGMFGISLMGYRGLNAQYMSSTAMPPALLLLLTIGLWTICAVLVGKRIVPTLRSMLRQKSVTAFLFLAYLSTLWSEDPLLTLRKAVLLLFVFTFACFFVLYYTPADQMRLLFAVGVILGLASIGMALLLPRYGLDVAGGWKGIFGQKNHLGHAMLYLFSGLAFTPVYGTRQQLKLVMKSAVPIALILLSQSKGSLLLVALLIAVRVCAPILKKSRRDQLPFFLYLLLFGSAAIVLGRGLVLSLLGRDSTLTGRTHEWAVLIPFALTHQWLGYGFQAFWTGTGDSLHAMRLVGATMHGSDSGFIDMMLQFGFLGLTLWLIVFLTTLREFIQVMRTSSIPLIGYWYFGLIVITVVGSYTEYLFPLPGGIPTFMFVFACVGLRNLHSSFRYRDLHSLLSRQA